MFDLDLRRCATSLGSENWELCISTSICGVGLAMHGTETYEDKRWISSAGSDYSSFGSLSGKIKHFQLSRRRRPKIDPIHKSGENDHANISTKMAYRRQRKDSRR